MYQAPSVPLCAAAMEKEPAGRAYFSFVTPWPMTVSSIPPCVEDTVSGVSAGAASVEELVTVNLASAILLPSKN